MSELNVTVTAAQVAPVFEKFGKCEIYTGVASSTITAGQALYIVAATGLLAPTDEDSGGAGTQLCQFRGIALNGGGEDQAIDYIMHGPVYGFTLAGNFDSLLFLSDDAGRICTTAPGTNTVEVGRVFALSDIIASSGLPSKVLFVDVDMAQADHSGP